MVYPVVPEDKYVFIRVQNGRCQVARFRRTERFTFGIEPARNWRALEADARTAVEDHSGAITEDDQFPCPPPLAARAVWALDHAQGTMEPD